MRDLYLLDDSVVFLNHGSFGACSRPVFEQYQAWQLELERQPVEFLGRRYNDLMRESLATLGDFVGTTGENLVFALNATAGLNMVARSLKLGPGDEVLTTDHEYNALNMTWKYIQRETGCKIVPVKVVLPLDDPAQVVDAMWSAVTPQTRVIFLSHITSPTALIFPVEEICRRAREAGILTMIDGAHVPGHLPLTLDMLDVDFYSGNLHKWLSSPKGAAFTYIRPEHHHLIDPLVISHGWESDDLSERTRWQGTRDVAAYLSVPAAIEFQRAHDWETVSTDCRELARETMHRICDLTGQPPIATDDFFAQMVAAPLPDDADIRQLSADLYEQHRVEIPLISHGRRKFARVSIAAYNTKTDADTLVDALASLLDLG